MARAVGVGPREDLPGIERWRRRFPSAHTSLTGQELGERRAFGQAVPPESQREMNLFPIQAELFFNQARSARRPPPEARVVGVGPGEYPRHRELVLATSVTGAALGCQQQ